MKSTPEQTSKRRELKRLVEELGDLASERFPDVAACGIIASKNAPLSLDQISYDEFFVVAHATRAIPAVQTNGRVFLRFRRRITRDLRYQNLWHVWEPGYAATKPEMVEELLPVVRAHLDSLQTA